MMAVDATGGGSGKGDGIGSDEQQVLRIKMRSATSVEDKLETAII